MFNFKTKLKNPKFKIKGTQFSVTKLPPMRSFSLSEFIRVNLARAADSFTIDDKASEKENAVLFFKAVLGLDPEVVEHIRVELFENIEFQGSGVERGFAQLSGMEDMAFQDFEVIHIYEVLGRALFINFFASFSGISSTFPGVEKYLKQQAQST